MGGMRTQADRLARGTHASLMMGACPAAHRVRVWLTKVGENNQAASDSAAPMIERASCALNG